MKQEAFKLLYRGESGHLMLNICFARLEDGVSAFFGGWYYNFRIQYRGFLNEANSEGLVLRMPTNQV